MEGSKRNIFKGGSFIDELPKNDFEISESEFKPELFYDKSFGTDTRDYNSDNISLLKEMYDLCKSRNIKFDIFFLPEYVSLYKNVDIDKFNSLKKQLVNFTPFYDFTGINAISTDKKYWQDPVHVNSWTSKLIVDRIFYEDKNQPPKIKNFGVYVTKQNFDNHIKNLNLEMEKYLKTNQK